jgi:hypothetical protein
VPHESCPQPDTTFVVHLFNELIHNSEHMCCSAQRASQLGYTLTGIGEVAMPRNESPSASPRRLLGVVRRDPATESLWAVTQRLANAERELRVQFIRIAQLQAQLDLVLARTPDVRRIEFT